MKSVIIYTPYDCMVKYGDEQAELSQNEHLYIDYVRGDIAVYPVGKTDRYAFQINISNNRSTFYRIVEKEDKTLVFLLDGLLCENCDVHKFQYRGKDFSVDTCKNAVFFSSDASKCQVCLGNTPQNFTCGHFLHIAYAQFSQNEQDVILLYNINNGKMRKCVGDKITLDENGFTVKQNFHGGFEAVQQKFIVDNDGLKCLHQSVEAAETPMNEDLTAFQFMSAIKDRNFSLAHSMLCSSLQDKISIKTLSSYFGEISYLYMLDDCTCFALSDGQNVVYDFIVQNGKINDISDNKA